MLVLTSSGCCCSCVTVDTTSLQERKLQQPWNQYLARYLNCMPAPSIEWLLMSWFQGSFYLLGEACMRNKVQLLSSPQELHYSSILLLQTCHSQHLNLLRLFSDCNFLFFLVLLFCDLQYSSLANPHGS